MPPQKQFMSRLCCHPVPILLFLLLILICGKLLLSSAGKGTVSAIASGPGVSVSDSSPWIERGWPWVYERTWSPFSFGLLLADIAVLLSAMAAVGMLLIWCVKRRVQWWQFSLRALFLSVAVVAIGFAWLNYQRSQWQQEQQLAAHLKLVLIPLGDEEYFGPEWLRRFLSDDQLTIFYHFTSLDTGNDLPPSEIATVWGALSQLPHVHTLRIGKVFEFSDPFSSREDEAPGILITPSRIADPRVLFQIEALIFSQGGATDDTLKILSSLPRLRRLDLDNCPISDAGISSLAACRTIQSLCLRYTKISDAGVAQLLSLPELTDLSLTGTQITDSAIDTLVRMRRLENLNIICDALTDSAVRRILDLPNLASGEFPQPPQISEETRKLLEDQLTERWAAAGGGFF
jgi:hypothetical protein